MVSAAQEKNNKLLIDKFMTILAIVYEVHRTQSVLSVVTLSPK